MACRTRRAKADLIRVVRLPAGRVVVDAPGRSPGRGAYVCRRPDCVVAATRRGALGRALRVRLSPEDLATLRGEMEKEIG